MAEQKESSVLFSLKELMSLEENRIREEEADKERRAREESERRAADERAKRDAEERRIRDEEERRRTEEQRRKEEEARLEAIKHGELEKARSEAEHRARMEALAAHQAHEQQLAALNSDSTKKRLKLFVGMAIAAVLVIGTTAGVVIKNRADQSEREKVAAAAALKESEEKFNRLKSEFELAQKKEEELNRSLESAKDDATKARIEAELKAAKERTAAAGAAVRGGGRPAAKGGGGAAKPCSCPPGDPLCSCL